MNSLLKTKTKTTQEHVILAQIGENGKQQSRADSFQSFGHRNTYSARCSKNNNFFLNRKGQRQASDNERQKKNVRKKRHIK